MSKSSKIRSEVGATLLEFALAFGVFIILIFGTLEFARFMAIRSIQVKATQAALAEMQRSEVMQTDLSKCGYVGSDPVLLAEKNNCLNFVPMFESRRDAIAMRTAAMLTSAFISMPGSGGNAELVEFRHSYPTNSASQALLPVGFMRPGDVVVDTDKNIPASYGFPAPVGSGTWQGKLSTMPFMVITRVKLQPIIHLPFLPAVMDVSPVQAFGYAELPKTTRIPPDLALPFPPAPPTTTTTTTTTTTAGGSCQCSIVGPDPSCDGITGPGSSCDGCNCSAPPPPCPGQLDCSGWCCALTETCGGTPGVCNPPVTTSTTTTTTTPTTTPTLPTCVCPASTTCSGTDICQGGGCTVSGGDTGLCVPGACAGYTCNNGGTCIAPGGVPSCDCSSVVCSVGSPDATCTCPPVTCGPGSCDATCEASQGLNCTAGFDTNSCFCNTYLCWNGQPAPNGDAANCPPDPCGSTNCNGGTCDSSSGSAVCDCSPVAASCTYPGTLDANCNCLLPAGDACCGYTGYCSVPCPPFSIQNCSQLGGSCS